MPCFDRTDETKTLWSQFRAGRNLLMLAPRRIGKTVLLNHLRESAAAQGFRAIVLDVEGLRDEKASALRGALRPWAIYWALRSTTRPS